MNRILLSILTLLPVFYCSGQTDSLADDAYDYLFDFRLADNENVENYDAYFRENPVNVNTASEEILMQMPGIDHLTASKIISERKKRGRFFSLTEVINIGGIDRNLVIVILPYMTLEERKDYEITLNGKENPQRQSRVSAKLRCGYSLNQGSSDSRFAGPGFRLYNRFYLKGDNWNSSFFMEKDAGEAEAADFKSFSIQIRDTGFVKSITAGDYYVEFGQGLSMWRPGMFLSQPVPFASLKGGRGIVSASGLNETKFLRGAAASIGYKDFVLTAYISNTKRDAVKDSGGHILRLMSEGLHRTQTEIFRKNNCREVTFGLLTAFNPDPALSAEILFNHAEFDLPVKTHDEEKERESANLLSAAFSYNMNSLKWMSETKLLLNSVSTCNSINYILSNNAYVYLRLSALSFTGQEFTKTAYLMESMERLRDFTTGLRMQVLHGIMYAHFSNSSGYYKDSRIRHRSEAGISLFYPMPENADLSLKIKFSKEDEEIYETVRIIPETHQLNLRAGCLYRVNKNLKFNWKAAYCSTGKKGEESLKTGFSLSNEFSYNMIEKISIHTRITLYNINSYDARLYELERDVPGSFYSSVLSGKGVKWYLLISAEVWKNALVILKYADDSRAAYDSEIYEYSFRERNRFSIQFDFRI